MPAPRTLGQRIQAMRLAAHLTRADLARRVDKDLSLISRWERDQRVPTVESLVKMAGIFRLGGLDAFGLPPARWRRRRS